MESRYDRNIRIIGFGQAGQDALSRARILVIGAGGLGSPALLYLAAAGAGQIGIADGDTVSESNLQRQILYRACDVGRSKAEAACEALHAQNPDVRLVCYPERLTSARMDELIPDYDCVLDCTDSMETKFAVNDCCVRLKTPYVHAGVLGLSGQVLSVAPGHACLRCAFPSPAGSPPTADQLGILGAAAGTIGAIQAAEAIKLVTGFGTPLFDTILHADLTDGTFIRIPLERSLACPACGNGEIHA